MIMDSHFLLWARVATPGPHEPGQVLDGGGKQSAAPLRSASAVQNRLRSPSDRGDAAHRPHVAAVVRTFPSRLLSLSGRGRTLFRRAERPAAGLAMHAVDDCEATDSCSLSPRKMARLRGNYRRYPRHMWRQASVLAAEGGILPPGTWCDQFRRLGVFPAWFRLSSALSAGQEARLRGRQGYLTATAP